MLLWTFSPRRYLPRGSSGVWTSRIGLSVFPFKKANTNICDRSYITLARCNQVCIWMDVIRKLVIKVVIFEMEGMFGSYLIYFVITFV